MSSEGLVRLMILCLTLIELTLTVAISVLLWRHTEATVVGSLVTLAATAVGGLGSLLANAGSPISAKSGGTVEIQGGEIVEPTKRFELILSIVANVYEGSYSCDIDDAGGATNLGIEYTEWQAWCRAQGKPESTLHQFAHELMLADVRPLYLKEYWLAAGCDKLPAPLDAVVFDTAVNTGVGKALHFLNETQGMADVGQRVACYQQRRVAYYEAIIAHNPSQGKFRSSWEGRVHDLSRRIAEREV